MMKTKHRARVLLVAAVAAVGALLTQATPALASAIQSGFSAMDAAGSTSLYSLSDCQISIPSGQRLLSNGTTNVDQYNADVFATCDAIGTAVYPTAAAGPGAYVKSPTGFLGTATNLAGSNGPAVGHQRTTLVACDRDTGGTMRYRQIDILPNDPLPVKWGQLKAGCPWTAQDVADSLSVGYTATSGWTHVPSALGTAGNPAVAPTSDLPAETATRTGSSTVVTYGSGYQGTGWVTGMAVGDTITWSGLNLSGKTPLGIRIKSPFNSLTTKSCAEVTVNGTIVTPLNVSTEYADLIYGTPQPGGDWTNWGQSAYLMVRGLTSTNITSVSLKRIACASGNGNGFDVDTLTVWPTT